MSADFQVDPVSRLNRISLIGGLHRTSCFLILLMGIGHVAATPAMIRGEMWAKTLDGVYFGGAGLAVVFIAQLNLLLSFGALAGKRAVWSLYAANLAYLGFVVSLTITEPSPPVIVATLLALATTITAPISIKA